MDTNNHSTSLCFSNYNSNNNALRHRPLKSCLSVPCLAGLDDSNNSSSTSNTNKPSRNVSFCRIEIREYEQTLVENPSVSCGPALGLDWTYNPKSRVFDVEEYEAGTGSRRRSKAEMIMPQSYREMKLEHEWDVSSNEMKRMNKKTLKIRKQRLASIRTPDSIERTIDVFNTAKRKLIHKKKRFRDNLRKNTSSDSKNNSKSLKQQPTSTMMKSRKTSYSMNDMTVYEPAVVWEDDHSCEKSKSVIFKDTFDNDNEKEGNTASVESSNYNSNNDDDDDWGFGLDEEELIPVNF